MWENPENTEVQHPGMEIERQTPQLLAMSLSDFTASFSEVMNYFPFSWCRRTVRS